MEPEEVAVALGRNLRTLRQRRRMSIEALASAAGVSRGTVIQIEAGRSNPGIGTLVHLAETLGVGVASLIDVAKEPRISVRRAERAVPLWMSAAGSRAVFLMGSDPPDAFELWDWTLQPGDCFVGEPHPLGTIEVLHVLEGQLRLTVGSEALDETTEEHAYLLGSGDTVLFEAHAPHRYAHVDGGVARFLMFIQQPGDTGIGPPAGIAPAT
jgi:transcriptional regulator with XRE-family HTH domain